MTLRDLINENLFCDIELVVKVFLEALRMVRLVHEQGYVLRNITAEGISIKFIDPQVYLRLIDFRDTVKLGSESRGDPIYDTKYLSVNVHARQAVPTCKDDLVSLCFLVISMARCGLPWEKMDSVSQLEMKLRHTGRSLF